MSACPRLAYSVGHAMEAQRNCYENTSDCFAFLEETNTDSGTPRNEATERPVVNETTKGFQAKMKRVGWPNGFQIRGRAYMTDCFGFLRRRRRLRELLEAKQPDGPNVERRGRSSLPKRCIPHFFERQSAFASLSKRERNRTIPN